MEREQRGLARSLQICLGPRVQAEGQVLFRQPTSHSASKDLLGKDKKLVVTCSKYMFSSGASDLRRSPAFYYLSQLVTAQLEELAASG